MLSASTRDSPSRVVISRQSVPKFEMRISPLRAKARPLGRVPSRYRPDSLSGALEGLGTLLGDDALTAIGSDPHDAAAGVGRPQNTIGFRQNALGALQIVAHVLQRGLVDAEVEYRIHDCRRPSGES